MPPSLPMPPTSLLPTHYHLPTIEASSVAKSDTMTGQLDIWSDVPPYPLPSPCQPLGPLPPVEASSGQE